MAFKTLASKSQNVMLLNHFKIKGNITAIEAAAMYRVRSLTRRITDLKQRGHSIRSEVRTDATGQRYTRYHYQGVIG